MKLTILERIILPSLLPKESDFATMRKVTDVRDRISFVEKEIKEFEITEKDGQVSWNKKGEGYEPDIDLGDIVEKEITEALIKKNTDRKLGPNELSLYHKFVIK